MARTSHTLRPGRDRRPGVYQKVLPETSIRINEQVEPAGILSSGKVALPVHARSRFPAARIEEDLSTDRANTPTKTGCRRTATTSHRQGPIHRSSCIRGVFPRAPGRPPGRRRCRPEDALRILMVVDFPPVGADVPQDLAVGHICEGHVPEAGI